MLAGVCTPPHGASSSSAPSSPRRRFVARRDGEPPDEVPPGSNFRFLLWSGEEGAAARTLMKAASSRDRFTSSALMVRARTISNARKPRISMVSSERSSSWEGRLRYSLNRLA